jgi:recombination protein RecT
MSELVPIKQKALTIRELLNKQQNELARAVPRHIDPARFLRTTLTVIMQNQKLLDCTPQSIVGAMMQAGAWGLELDPGLGQAYLVPYFDRRNDRNLAQLQIGYQGMIALALRSQQVKKIIARAVYEKDVFHYSFGLEEKLEHVPSDADDPGPLVYVYAVAALDSDKQFDVMSKAEVEKVRKRSRAADSGPWVTDYDSMAKKTVVRRLCKFLPKSTELAQVIAREERFERGEEIVDLPEESFTVEAIPRPQLPEPGATTSNMTTPSGSLLDQVEAAAANPKKK